MHEHCDCECKHELKWCEHCDVTYCRKCKREWGKVVYTPYYPWWTNTTPYPPYIITYTSSTTAGNYAVISTHIHS